ncbi:hypothetical protein FRC17_009093 [Serendipita sp. 399]|nr:hypothetical protein FRC17_009093 [Serendipita sp. 399]
MSLVTIAAPVHTAHIGQLAKSMYLDMVCAQESLDTAYRATIRISGSESDPTNWAAKQLRERLARLWRSISSILLGSRQFGTDAITLSERFRTTHPRELHSMMKGMLRIGEELLPKISKSEEDLQALPDEFPYAAVALIRTTGYDEHTPLKESIKDLQNAENDFRESIGALRSRHEAMRQFWKRQLEFLDYVLNNNDASQLSQITASALELASSWRAYDKALEVAVLDIQEISDDITVPKAQPTEAKEENDSKPLSFAWKVNERLRA